MLTCIFQENFKSGKRGIHNAFVGEQSPPEHKPTDPTPHSFRNIEVTR